MDFFAKKSRQKGQWNYNMEILISHLIENTKMLDYAVMLVLGSIATMGVAGLTYELARLYHNENLISALVALLENDTAIEKPIVQEQILKIKKLLHAKLL